MGSRFGEVLNEINKISPIVYRKFHELAKRDAEDIAQTLFDEIGANEVCKDISQSISQSEEMIQSFAECESSNDFDNALLAIFHIYPEEEMVNNRRIKEVACSKNPEAFFNEAIRARAHELWVAAIKRYLREVLENKCRTYYLRLK